MQKLVEVGHTGTHEYVQQFCVKQLLGTSFCGCRSVSLASCLVCQKQKSDQPVNNTVEESNILGRALADDDTLIFQYHANLFF